MKLLSQSDESGESNQVTMQEMPDLNRMLFARRSFDEAIPGDWNRVADENRRVDASEEETTATTDTTAISPSQPSRVDEIRSALEDLAVDDWEDAYESS